MVSNRRIIEVVLNKLVEYKAENIVIDPVIAATSGKCLLWDVAMEALITKLLPIATIITPNIPEAETLSGLSIKDENNMAYLNVLNKRVS